MVLLLCCNRYIEAGVKSSGARGVWRSEYVAAETAEKLKAPAMRNDVHRMVVDQRVCMKPRERSRLLLRRERGLLRPGKVS